MRSWRAACYITWQEERDDQEDGNTETRIIAAATQVHRGLGPGFVDFAQTRSYLKASGYKVGLLINFLAAKLQVKRLVN
jgi:hypothetical protein